MLICEYTFAPKEPSTLNALEDEVVGLLGSLEKNGQIWGSEVFGHVEGSLRVVFTVPRSDALSDRYKSEWVLRAEKRVRPLCDREPTWHVIDDRANEQIVERWMDSESLYLFTHMFDHTSPVCSGSDGEPVPLYLLDVKQETRQALVAWAGEFRQLDELQLGCGPLEIAAYTEVATPASELAKSGRELCRDVEEATGKPTYYYLMRHWGRETGEADRLCPGCGKKWAASAKEGERGIAWFDFRCAPCRLVSHVAVSFDSEKFSEIGEWIPIENGGPQ